MATKIRLGSGQDAERDGCGHVVLAVAHGRPAVSVELARLEARMERDLGEEPDRVGGAFAQRGDARVHDARRSRFARSERRAFPRLPPAEFTVSTSTGPGRSITASMSEERREMPRWPGWEG